MPPTSANPDRSIHKKSMQFYFDQCGMRRKPGQSSANLDDIPAVDFRAFLERLTIVNEIVFMNLDSYGISIPSETPGKRCLIISAYRCMDFRTVQIDGRMMNCDKLVAELRRHWPDFKATVSQVVIAAGNSATTTGRPSLSSMLSSRLSPILVRGFETDVVTEAPKDMIAIATLPGYGNGNELQNFRMRVGRRGSAVSVLHLKGSGVAVQVHEGGPGADIDLSLDEEERCALWYHAARKTSDDEMLRYFTRLEMHRRRRRLSRFLPFRRHH
ncbi:hypothetical protein [Cupriavidus pauculus]|jgi:hypothetical protein|uniref:hypothetical protein n=1 Tax=Cupriavidus pauculus TaxID=82633 RepID=UPI00385781F8